MVKGMEDEGTDFLAAFQEIMPTHVDFAALVLTKVSSMFHPKPLAIIVTM